MSQPSEVSRAEGRPALNAETKPKQTLFDAALGLAADRPQLFAARADRNYFYSGRVVVSATLATSRGDYDLVMSMGLTRAQGFLRQGLHIKRDGNNIYRLDVEAGEGARRFKDVVERLGGPVDAGDWYAVAPDGTVTTYMSQFDETQITDEEAAEIITSAADLRIPEQLEGTMTLADFLRQTQDGQTDPGQESVRNLAAPVLRALQT